MVNGSFPWKFMMITDHGSTHAVYLKPLGRQPLPRERERLSHDVNDHPKGKGKT